MNRNSNWTCHWYCVVWTMSKIAALLYIHIHGLLHRWLNDWGSVDWSEIQTAALILGQQVQISSLQIENQTNSIRFLRLKHKCAFQPNGCFVCAPLWHKKLNIGNICGAHTDSSRWTKKDHIRAAADRSAHSVVAPMKQTQNNKPKCHTHTLIVS